MEAFLAVAGEDIDDEGDNSFAITPLTQLEQKELDQFMAIAEANPTPKLLTEPTLAEMKEDPYFQELVDQARNQQAKEKAEALPSYAERHRELYQKRNQGETSYGEFRRRVQMTPEQIRQEELFPRQPASWDRAGDQYLMNHEPT